MVAATREVGYWLIGHVHSKVVVCHEEGSRNWDKCKCAESLVMITIEWSMRWPSFRGGDGEYLSPN